MNIKLDRKKILAAAVLAILILLSLGFLFLCQPLLRDIDKARYQENAYVQEALFLRNLLETRKTTGIVAQLITQEKISLVMDAITRSAGNKAVSLTLLRPPFVGQAKAEGFKRVLVDMQATATLKNMGVFLMAVRNMPEGLVDIDSLRLAPDESGADMVTAKITFVLFVAKDHGQK